MREIADALPDEVLLCVDGVHGFAAVDVDLPDLGCDFLSAGIVCLDVPGLPPANAVLTLREQGIVASATPYATSYLRLGPSIVTSPDEVDAAIEAVGSLAQG